MKAYAGIGSRDISDKEISLITKIANSLSSEYIVYSGNADGSDITFQKGSNGNCVVYLPWDKFNYQSYDASTNALDAIVCGNSKDGWDKLKLHPKSLALSFGAKKLMVRNYHQVVGYGQYPVVDFVICCADPTSDGVKGGTGQAVRIAKSRGIPVYNIRDKNDLNYILQSFCR